MDFAAFKQQVSQKFGLYLDGYKETQLKRRIDSLLQLRGITTYDEYWKILASDMGERKRLLDRITINVSEFFRNAEIFAQLEKSVLPLLLSQRQGGRPLRIWSAACANGAEAYSLAILFYEINPEGRQIIDATDIDDKVLDIARQGEYRAENLKNVSPERLKKFFDRDGSNFVIKGPLRRMVNFYHEDLLRDSYRTGYHLIVCRNVVIYFTRETQSALYRRLYQALAPGGVLFVGATESIWEYRDMGFSKLSPWFYRKAGE